MQADRLSTRPLDTGSLSIRKCTGTVPIWAIQLKRSGNQDWSLDIKGTLGPYCYSDIKLSRMTRTDKYGAQFITLYDAPGGAIYEKVVVEY